MARRIKVSIVNPDRTTMVKYITQKNMIGSQAFRLPKTNEVYVLDPKHSVMTTTKRLGVPFRYITFYFKRNVPAPVKWADISGGQVELAVIKEKDHKGNEIEKIIAEKAIPVPNFNDAPYSSIPSKELGQLLNPEFMNMITRANRNKKDNIIFYLQCAACAGIGFIIYYMMQNLPKALAHAVGN